MWIEKPGYHGTAWTRAFLAGELCPDEMERGFSWNEILELQVRLVSN